MIFQDPYASLNARMTVGDIIGEGIDIHKLYGLIRLQRDLHLTYLFIAHDLSMVKHISDRVAVMYLGVLMEVAPSNVLYSSAVHLYTQSLLSAIPIPDPVVEKQRQRILLEGDVPSPVNPSEGCRFKGRCRFAKPVCSEIQPELKEIGTNHFAACHLIG